MEVSHEGRPAPALDSSGNIPCVLWCRSCHEREQNGALSALCVRQVGRWAGWLRDGSLASCRGAPHWPQLQASESEDGPVFSLGQPVWRCLECRHTCKPFFAAVALWNRAANTQNSRILGGSERPLQPPKCEPSVADRRRPSNGSHPDWGRSRGPECCRARQPRHSRTNTLRRDPTPPSPAATARLSAPPPGLPSARLPAGPPRGVSGARPAHRAPLIPRSGPKRRRSLLSVQRVVERSA